MKQKKYISEEISGCAVRGIKAYRQETEKASKLELETGFSVKRIDDLPTESLTGGIVKHFVSHLDQGSIVAHAAWVIVLLLPAIKWRRESARIKGALLATIPSLALLTIICWQGYNRSTRWNIYSREPPTLEQMRN